MAVAFVQEFEIKDRSTANYDFVKERIGDDPIEGLIIHTAAFRLPRGKASTNCTIS